MSLAREWDGHTADDVLNRLLSLRPKEPATKERKKPDQSLRRKAMQIKTKGDLARAALRKLGVASDATLTDIEPQSMQDAVDDLEAMMAEWYQDGKGIITGYIFSDDDNPPAEGDDHGLRSSAVSAVFHNLACRIAPDYALEATAKIIATAKYGKELLYKLDRHRQSKKSSLPVTHANRQR